jgi:aminoglycoside phosphotransferase family enzyme/predicted kinase
VIVEDQSEVVAFLSGAAAYGADVTAVERIETHVSVVFLAGERAYKLKRAARFAYLDFSTLERRRAACEAEVAINRRTAPTLYRRAVPVTRRGDGRLQLGGGGAIVEWLVEMARFDNGTLFDRLAQKGVLDRRLMETLARAIARFHDSAEICRDVDPTATFTAIIESSAASFAEFASSFDPGAVARLNERSRAELSRCRSMLEERRAAGRVRRCHGDLHLRNICLVDGQPTLFDAIEFNETLTRIDVLYDVAFLVMDLDHRHLRPLANVVLNAYTDVSADDPGLALMPLFLSLRAAIRAHVEAATVGRLADPEQRALCADDARRYLAEAGGYLVPTPPRLVAVGGLSGSGKSRLARALAPLIGAAPGARVVRSDVVRKRLLGVNPESRLEPGGYSKDMTERTYAKVYDLARFGLRAGRAVIADAVFARPEQRRAVAAVAAEAGVPFQGLWLEAPPAVMAERIATRRHNASDATVEILRQQLDYDLGAIDWPRLDSAGSKTETLRQAVACLGL